ncbi:IS1 family transposase [Providencia rettgeri]
MKSFIQFPNHELENRLKRLNCKTLGSPKSAEMRDKIISTFIKYEHYLL